MLDLVLRSFLVILLSTIALKIRTMFWLDVCQVCALASKEKKFATECPAENNYAACVKKKGQSTCVTAIDDSPHTFLLSIFFWNSVETF